MKWQALFLIAAGAAGFAYAVPESAPRVAPAGPAERVVSESKVSSFQSSDWYGGTTVLERQGDGHFYADVLVKGNPVRFMVDTGASMVVLTEEDAFAGGIAWDPAEVRQIGHGASGPVYGVSTQIPELELGEFVIRDVPAAIVPEGLSISLLGQSFLSRIRRVGIEEDRMVLSADQGADGNAAFRSFSVNPEGAMLR